MQVEWNRIYSDALDTDLYQHSEDYDYGAILHFEIWEDRHSVWRWAITYEYLDDNYEIMDSEEDTFEEAESQLLSWYSRPFFRRLFRLTFNEDRRFADEGKWVSIGVTFHHEYADVPQKLLIGGRPCEYTAEEGVVRYVYNEHTCVEVRCDTTLVRGVVGGSVIYERYTKDKEEMLREVRRAKDEVNRELRRG